MTGKAIGNRGFTLLELLASIAVMTIIGVIAGMGLVEIAKGYVLSKKNTTVAQQGQITMARLKKGNYSGSPTMEPQLTGK